MDDSSEPNGVATASCLWCGAQRPVDVAKCPSCEHAWIDATIDEATSGALQSPDPIAPSLQPTRPWWRNPRLPLAVAAAAMAVYGLVFWILWDGTQPDPVAAATTTSTTSLSPATTAAGPTQTTGAQPTTTTVAPTTTTTTTLPPIPELGPPFAPEELSLGAFALGPLQFGIDAAAPIGRLAATYGQPADQFPVGENWGLCPTSTGRALRWGTLSVILRDDPDGEVVVGYRQLTRTEEEAVTTTTALLQTISGLRLGATLSRVQALYSTVATAELDDGSSIFLVLRSSDRRTLLWGELSNDQEPVVLSINSPRPCDGGPFAP